MRTSKAKSAGPKKRIRDASRRDGSSRSKLMNPFSLASFKLEVPSFPQQSRAQRQSQPRLKSNGSQWGSLRSVANAASSRTLSSIIGLSGTISSSIVNTMATAGSNPGERLGSGSGTAHRQFHPTPHESTSVTPSMSDQTKTVDGGTRLTRQQQDATPDHGAPTYLPIEAVYNHRVSQSTHDTQSNSIQMASQGRYVRRSAFGHHYQSSRLFHSTTPSQFGIFGASPVVGGEAASSPKISDKGKQQSNQTPSHLQSGTTLSDGKYMKNIDLSQQTPHVEAGHMGTDKSKLGKAHPAMHPGENTTPVKNIAPGDSAGKTREDSGHSNKDAYGSDPADSSADDTVLKRTSERHLHITSNPTLHLPMLSSLAPVHMMIFQSAFRQSMMTHLRTSLQKRAGRGGVSPSTTLSSSIHPNHAPSQHHGSNPRKQQQHIASPVSTSKRFITDERYEYEKSGFRDKHFKINRQKKFAYRLYDYDVISRVLEDQKQLRQTLTELEGRAARQKIVKDYIKREDFEDLNDRQRQLLALAKQQQMDQFIQDLKIYRGPMEAIQRRTRQRQAYRLYLKHRFRFLLMPFQFLARRVSAFNEGRIEFSNFRSRREMLQMIGRLNAPTWTFVGNKIKNSFILAERTRHYLMWDREGLRDQLRHQYMRILVGIRRAKHGESGEDALQQEAEKSYTSDAGPMPAPEISGAAARAVEKHPNVKEKSKSALSRFVQFWYRPRVRKERAKTLHQVARFDRRYKARAGPPFYALYRDTKAMFINNPGGRYVRQTDDQLESRSFRQKLLAMSDDFARYPHLPKLMRMVFHDHMMIKSKRYFKIARYLARTYEPYRHSFRNYYFKGLIDFHNQFFENKKHPMTFEDLYFTAVDRYWSPTAKGMKLGDMYDNRIYNRFEREGGFTGAIGGLLSFLFGLFLTWLMYMYYAALKQQLDQQEILKEQYLYKANGADISYYADRLLYADDTEHVLEELQYHGALKLHANILTRVGKLMEQYYVIIHDALREKYNQDEPGSTIVIRPAELANIANTIKGKVRDLEKAEGVLVKRLQDMVYETASLYAAEADVYNNPHEHSEDERQLHNDLGFFLMTHIDKIGQSAQFPKYELQPNLSYVVLDGAMHTQDGIVERPMSYEMYQRMELSGYEENLGIHPPSTGPFSHGGVGPSGGGLLGGGKSNSSFQTSLPGGGGGYGGHRSRGEVDILSNENHVNHTTTHGEFVPSDAGDSTRPVYMSDALGLQEGPNTSGRGPSFGFTGLGGGDGYDDDNMPHIQGTHTGVDGKSIPNAFDLQDLGLGGSSDPVPTPGIDSFRYGRLGRDGSTIIPEVAPEYDVNRPQSEDVSLRGSPFFPQSFEGYRHRKVYENQPEYYDAHVRGEVAASYHKRNEQYPFDPNIYNYDPETVFGYFKPRGDEDGPVDPRTGPNGPTVKPDEFGRGGGSGGSGIPGHNIYGDEEITNHVSSMFVDDG